MRWFERVHMADANAGVVKARPTAQARLVARLVRWPRLAVGFTLAFGMGVAIALALKAVGWWPGALWEQNVLHLVHRTVRPWLDPVMLVLPLFGTNYSLAPIVAVAATVFWRKRYYALALHLAIVQAGSWILNPALKFAFPRARPTFYEARGQYAFPAFPSGHSIAVVAVLLTCALLLYRYRGRTWGFWMVGGFFLLNSYSRIYLSVHWPTDLIGGTMIGAIWMAFCWSAFREAHVQELAQRANGRTGPAACGVR
jgi:membrane-associated phospholipid phosphatase